MDRYADDFDYVDPEELLESGKVTEDTPIEEIEAMMRGEDPASKAASDPEETGKTEDKGEPDDSESQPDQTEDGADETQDSDKETATDSKQHAEDTSARDQQTDDGKDSDADNNASFKSHPIYGVLKGTRTNLQKAREALEQVQQERDRERQERERLERELNEARAQLQRREEANAKRAEQVQAAAKAAGVKGDVRTVDVEKLRGEFPDEIVNAIEALQAQNALLQQEIARFRERDAASEAEAQQADIDSVPSLAQWQAEGGPLWKAACALDDALLADPNWQGKPRIERYREIARLLGGDAGASSQKQQQQRQQQESSANQDTAAGTKAKAEAALQRAAQKAVPLSHSGLPAGSPPAQSELESLERLSITQLADKVSELSDDQLDRLLAKFG